MNVSTKSEYGLRALIYLASQDDRRAVPAREIAAEWNVPVKYLEQILKSPVLRSVASTVTRGLMGALLGRPRRRRY